MTSSLFRRHNDALPQSNGNETLYRSKTGKIQTHAQWEWEARRFYRHCETPMPTDWWGRWTLVLGIVKHDVTLG